MNQKDLIELAKKYFIFDASLSKANLIRKIQTEQGHTDCYATGKTDCDQLTCWWRKGCLSASAEDTESELINDENKTNAHENQ